MNWLATLGVGALIVGGIAYVVFILRLIAGICSFLSGGR